MQEIKLVVFDLNKTLIHENTWHDLNLAMGVTQEEDERFMLWYETGKITYEEGQKMLERIYKSHGRAKKETMVKLISQYQYLEGAQDIVAYLKDKGYHVALITGSFDVLAKKVSEELGIEHFSAHNRLEFDEKGNFSRIICDGYDYEFKAKELQRLCDELGIDVTQVVFVGDGDNDTYGFEMTGHGVTFKGSRVEDRAWRVIETLEDLKTFL